MNIGIDIRTDLNDMELLTQLNTLFDEYASKSMKPVSRFDPNSSATPTGPTAFLPLYAIDNKNKKLVGYTIVVFPNPASEISEMPKGTAFVDGYVLDERRREGIATLMLQELKRRTKKYSWDNLLFNTEDRGSVEFLHNHGAVSNSEHTQQRLYISELDNVLLEKWSSIQLPDGYQMEMLESIGDSDIEVFCELYTDLQNNQTRDGNGNKHRRVLTPEQRRYNENIIKGQGRSWHTLVVRNERGDIVGLTEIHYNPEEPVSARQNLTGVSAAERGRGFGKLLKSKMIQSMVEKYPELEYIYTTNDVTNVPMRSINQKLGYSHYNTVTALTLAW